VTQINKIYAAAVVCVLIFLSYMVTSCVGNRNAKEIEVQKTIVVVKTSQLAELAESNARQADLIKVLESKSAILEGKLSVSLQKYESVKVAIKRDVPKNDFEMSNSLVSAGLIKGLGVSSDVSVSVINTKDASVVWNWYAESEKVPSLEQKIAVGTQLVLDQSAIIDNSKSLIDSLKVMSKNQQSALAINEERFVAQTAQYDAFKNQLELHK
jgi:hypothetical protein